MHRALIAPCGTLLVVLAGAASLLLSLEFWALDLCADAGGSYESFTFQCSVADASYRQIWSRPWTMWLLVIVFPAYITACTAVARAVLLSGAYSAKQKATQLLLVWLLPIAVVVVVGWFVRYGSAPLPKTPVNPYPREPQLPG